MDLSAGELFTSMVVSTVGLGFFLHGKRSSRPPQLAAGALLMVYPYFAPTVAWQLSLAGAILAGLWLALRAGW